MDPAGKFKSHVDTPRSPAQFGSLVVCLPSSHMGGELLVRRKDQTTTFAWGDSSSLEWAAFYSDSEHEVLEVTGGFRVTLNYNLYWHESSQTISHPPLNPKCLPLFQRVESLLQTPAFLPHGGLIGFYCAHLYPRNRQGTNGGTPFCLKGVDRALWLVLQRLDILQGVHTVFDWAENDEDIEEQQGREKELWGSTNHPDIHRGAAYREEFANNGRLTYYFTMKQTRL